MPKTRRAISSASVVENAGAFASKTPAAGVWEERDIGLRVWTPRVTSGYSTWVGAELGRPTMALLGYGAQLIIMSA